MFRCKLCGHENEDRRALRDEHPDATDEDEPFIEELPVVVPVDE